MISLFERQLMAMEREIEELKTAHLVGPGTTKFYGQYVDIAGPGNKYLTVTIDDEAPLPPILFRISDNSENQTVFRAEEGEREFVVAFIGLESGQVIRTLVISSSQIASIEVE